MKSWTLTIFFAFIGTICAAFMFPEYKFWPGFIGAIVVNLIIDLWLYVRKTNCKQNAQPKIQEQGPTKDHRRVNYSTRYYINTLEDRIEVLEAPKNKVD